MRDVSKRRCSGVLLLAALPALHACGGDSKASPQPAPPANNLPVFTSANSVTIAENGTGEIYTAAATDADGEAISYAISGGADAALFSIVSTGRLSLAILPDFEAPQDANADNVYEVTIAARDGKGASQLNLQVMINNLVDAANVKRIASGMPELASLGGTLDHDVLVGTAPGGEVFEIDTESGLTTSKGNIFGSSLLIGPHRILAAYPSGDYSTNNEMFAAYIRYDDYALVSRYAINGSWVRNGEYLGGQAFDRATAQALRATGGTAPDGSVYLAFNDADNPDLAKPFGLIGETRRLLRNPNPFAGAAVKYFLSIGIAEGQHRPSFITFDGDSFFSGDSGDRRTEEINQGLAGEQGQHFGWPYFEGTREVRSGGRTGMILPVLAYDRTTVGPQPDRMKTGAAYAGPIFNFDGKILFADRSGKFFVVSIASLEAGTTKTLSAITEVTSQLVPDAGTIDSPLAITKDRQGRLFILDNDGELYRVDLK